MIDGVDLTLVAMNLSFVLYAIYNINSRLARVEALVEEVMRCCAGRNGNG